MVEAVRSTHSRAPIRLGILGCGAATERLHLPAIRSVPGIVPTLLVDRDLARAKDLASRFGVSEAEAGIEAAVARVDAVLIALPNRLHAPVAIDLLEKGIHVLVEKPMALSAAEGRALVSAAEQSNALLQIGQMKRFAVGAGLVKEAIAGGWLGPIRGFSIDWGVNFDWPLASDSGMNPTESGGGVLMDFGSHLLDLLCDWLGTPTEVAYADDALGGVEADCELNLTMEGKGGRIPGSARFSRIRTLENVVRIVGEGWTIEWAHESPDAVCLLPTVGDSGRGPAFRIDGAGQQSFGDLFVAQLQGFATAIATGALSPVSGASVLPSLELIERAYAARTALPRPWEVPVRLSPGAVQIRG